MICYALHTHRHDFIRRQRALVNRFVSGIEKFVVVNNGPAKETVKAECESLGVEFLFVGDAPAKFDQSFATGHALSELMAVHEWQGSLLVLDIDIFPTRPCYPPEWLTNAPFAAIELNAGSAWPFPGLMAIRSDIPHRRQLRFDPEFVGKHWCDTGAGIVNQMRDEPAFEWHRLDAFAPVAAAEFPKHLRERYDREFGFMRSGEWLHTTKATNWDKRPVEFVARKNAFINTYLDWLLTQ